MLKKLCGIVISSILMATLFAISNNNNVGILTQKALAQDNNNKTEATTNNMTKAGSMMMMGNKTTINADTLMTKIRNMGNASNGGIGGSAAVNMTNANAASSVMMGNKSG
jgi:hypothetical protein